MFSLLFPFSLQGWLSIHEGTCGNNGVVWITVLDRCQLSTERGMSPFIPVMRAAASAKAAKAAGAADVC
jgi:hypothetical protein